MEFTSNKWPSIPSFDEHKNQTQEEILSTLGHSILKEIPEDSHKEIIQLVIDNWNKGNKPWNRSTQIIKNSILDGIFKERYPVLSLYLLFKCKSKNYMKIINDNHTPDNWFTNLFITDANKKENLNKLFCIEKLKPIINPEQMRKEMLIVLKYIRVSWGLHYILRRILTDDCPDKSDVFISTDQMIKDCNIYELSKDIYCWNEI